MRRLVIVQIYCCCLARPSETFLICKSCTLSSAQHTFLYWEFRNRIILVLLINYVRGSIRIACSADTGCTEVFSRSNTCYSLSLHDFLLPLSHHSVKILSHIDNITITLQHIDTTQATDVQH